jgi:hypothetical protein
MPCPTAEGLFTAGRAVTHAVMIDLTARSCGPVLAQSGHDGFPTALSGQEQGRSPAVS